MRHARNIALIGIAMFIAAYLCGAFYETTFHLPSWKEETRENVVFIWFGTWATVACFYFPLNHE